MPDAAIEETPILIVGGGLVGLSAGLFLHHHGVPFILVERDREPSPLPRSRGIAPRTMELYRQIGLQEAVESAAKSAWEMGVFGGARRGESMLASEALDIPKRAMDGDPSPCTMTACPQTIVEPLLRRTLAERGCDASYGWEMIGLTQDDRGVTARVRDPDSAERTIMAQYLLAADGARGDIRRDLGIERDGTPADQYLLNIFFECDLADRIRDATFSQCEIANETVRGLFLAMNNTDKWSFHLEYDPDATDPDDWSEEDIRRRVAAAVGTGELPIKIRYHAKWNTRVRVADRYRADRVFLMGDAAHSMPPWGGFNANTGIADAHNLAWKLARVLAGTDDAALLDSYQEERRPIAVRNGEQSRLRTDFDARFNIRTDANKDYFDRLVGYGELQERYRYGTNDTVSALYGQPGTRFPHAWIEHDGTRRSTLDLFGRDYVTIGGPASADPGDGLYLRAGTDFRFVEDAVTWQSLTEGADDETIRVRPDGFVTGEARTARA